MVTENGLIQPKLDSPFEMANPYDLLAFLNQDTRWENIINLYHDLFKRKDYIRQLWADLERDSDVQAQLAHDKNCMKSGPLNQMDWYVSVLEDGKSRNIPDAEFKLSTPHYGQDTDVPDCKKISSLTFSMFAFEHLEAMIQRDNLTVPAELSLPEQISPIMNIDQFGHWAANMLRLNSSSWLHYNIASLYWRVRGNAPKAVECSRRAVHYAPRVYKDIALLSMGTIFHRSKKPEDALIVLSAAVDHAPHVAVNHFMLGSAYAVAGDFNNSMRHFDLCLKRDAKFDLAKKYKHGVLCHSTLLVKMKIIQELLDKLRIELLEYSQREAIWLKSQAAFLRTMKHHDDFDYRNVEKNCEKMSELTGLNIKELKKEGDKNSLISYFLDGPMYNSKWMGERGVQAVESAYSFQRLVKHIEKHADMVSDLVTPDEIVINDGSIKKEIGPTPEFSDVSHGKNEKQKSSEKSKAASSADNDVFEFEGGVVLYPNNMKVHRNKEAFDTEPDWPTHTFCRSIEQPKNLELIYPVFLPFENKGLRIKSLLTEMIGVPVSREHELPWHPPVCQESATFGKKSQKAQVAVEVASTEYLRLKLFEYVGDGDIEIAKSKQNEEIGQRIYSAMQLAVAPKWLLYTVSSLYWRVRGNNINAVNCLLPAAKSAPTRHKDIALTSLASVYLEMGYFEEAMMAAEEAYKLSMYEPSINFMIAQLNMVKKHRNTQLFHMKQVVRVQPRFMGGRARTLLQQWACRLFQKDLELGEGDICTQVEPGVSMVCERDGSNCHMTNIQCFSNKEKPETSTLVRMLELKGNGIQLSGAPIDEGLVESFMELMPAKKLEREAHQANYDRMRRSIEQAISPCRDRPCSSFTAEELDLREEDCPYQHLQLGYWLHIISYRQLLIDANIRLPIEITALPPSSKKIPECRLYSDSSQDFFLERLSRLDPAGWEPVLGLMHQLADTFNYFDYVTLGAKIAKYVDTRPRDWLAALTAGWWCGAAGHGACAARCLLAAAALADERHSRQPLLSAAALLQM
ncbi:unnamed protein product [Plutella xylostella]|uniref:(diamondback moth) hypothetical protein n=1 Tax=Plutella xylostella TaxID=51655 RepID=A0A8S4D016_PLUXY|nr:unnamed protein product [Plutella xylostella]